jgi:replication-associated recombination protein RarA
MEAEREKLLSALLDAVQRSKHFGSIPLPVALDNPLDELNEKYGYNKVDKKYLPRFEDDPPQKEEKEEFENIVIKKPTREELSKKLREKLKNHKKRVDKIPPKTIL